MRAMTENTKLVNKWIRESSPGYMSYMCHWDSHSQLFSPWFCGEWSRRPEQAHLSLQHGMVQATHSEWYVFMCMSMFVYLSENKFSRSLQNSVPCFMCRWSSSKPLPACKKVYCITCSGTANMLGVHRLVQDKYMIHTTRVHVLVVIGLIRHSPNSPGEHKL